MVLTQREIPATILERTVVVLKAFRHADAAGALTVAQIGELTGLPQSTTYRLVGDLVDAGLLERSGRAITLGMSLFELGQLASRRRSLREVALPYIADLREATQQTIHLAILDGIEVVYLEILPSHNGPPLPSRVGGRLPAYATGIGKALLAQHPTQIIDEIAAAGFRRLGPKTIRDVEVLRRQLRRVKSTNLAYDYEESGPKVVCVASAISDETGASVAAISASGWFGRVDLRRVAPAVLTCAKAITRNAGRRGISQP